MLGNRYAKTTEITNLINYLISSKSSFITGQTVIIDGDSEIKITPKLFKAVMFDNKPHYHYFPKQGHRVVGVFTFR